MSTPIAQGKISSSVLEAFILRRIAYNQQFTHIPSRAASANGKIEAYQAILEEIAEMLNRELRIPGDPRTAGWPAAFNLKERYDPMAMVAEVYNQKAKEETDDPNRPAVLDGINLALTALIGHSEDPRISLMQQRIEELEAETRKLENERDAALEMAHGDDW